jgi:hypothetical protein
VLTEIDLDSVQFIAFNMRDTDKEEIFNILEYDCAYRFGWEAFTIFNSKGRARIAWHQGRPAALIGLVEERPAVWNISMFGTNDLKLVAFECMRWARTNIPELIAPPHNGRRLQCDSRVGHEDAHKFLRALGAEPEGPPMRHYGKDGGDYIRFVWIFGANGLVEKGVAVGRLSGGAGNGSGYDVR